MDRNVYTKSFLFTEYLIEYSYVVVLGQSKLFELNIGVFWTLLKGIDYNNSVVGKMAFYHRQDTLTYRSVPYDKDSPLNIAITWKTLSLHSII